MSYNEPMAARLPWRTLCLALLLSSCATNGRVTEAVSGCAWARPILVSKADVLTDQTARQILAHNEAGRALCGWGPRSDGPKIFEGFLEKSKKTAGQPQLPV